MIQYSFARVEKQKDASGNVIGLVVGMSAIDITTGMSTYIDTVYNLPTPSSTLTVDDIRSICLQVAQVNNWYKILMDQITSLNNLPKIEPVSDI
jgi:hypothetical protein